MRPTKRIFKATAGVLATAIFAINSMVVFAAPTKVAGEILVADRGADVTVNGEVAQSGRSIFSGSTIDTPKNSGAIVSLGTLGRLELAPSTSVTLSFDEKGISASLIAGKITVVSATNSVNINGSNYGAGQSAETSTPQADNTQTSPSKSSTGSAWWIWAAVFGGALAGIVFASRTDNNRTALGGGTTVVSPLR